MSPSPVRPFGFWTATALVVGGMIGAGIFVLPAQLAPYGWTGVAGWAAAITGATMLAWILAQLAAAMPEETGAVAITGRAIGPLAGVLVGWSYWVSTWSANAIIALTAIRYLAVFVPALGQRWPQAVAAVALIWALTLLNLTGARSVGRFQVVTTLLKLLPLVAVVVILIGLVWPGGGGVSPASHAGFEPGGVTPALALAFYALVGFESASVAAERVRRPEVNILRATLAGCILTGLLYIIVCSGIVFVLPEAVLAATPAPLSAFVALFWGDGAGLAVAAFAVIAATGALNGWVLVQGEVPLGMARAGLLPRWVCRTNDRDVPTAMLLLASTLSSALILTSATGTLGGVLDFMLNLTAAATIWLYLGACVAAIRFGVARLVAGLGVLFCGWVLVGAGTTAMGLSIALMLSALPLYLLRSRAPADRPGTIPA